MTLFDIYRGRPLADGDKSLAYRLTLRDDDRTLTEAELDAAVAAVVAGADRRRRGAFPDLIRSAATATGPDRTAGRCRRCAVALRLPDGRCYPCAAPAPPEHG